MRALLAVAAVLVLWAGIAALRRRSEYRRTDGPPHRATGAATADDDIDRETLEQAEREVQDLDALQPPEEGFAGDDWGPGAPRR